MLKINEKQGYIAPKCNVFKVECEKNVLLEASSTREVDPCQEEYWGEL